MFGKVYTKISQLVVLDELIDSGMDTSGVEQLAVIKKWVEKDTKTYF